jgi:hypothetical protein
MISLYYFMKVFVLDSRVQECMRKGVKLDKVLRICLECVCAGGISKWSVLEDDS